MGLKVNSKETWLSECYSYLFCQIKSRLTRNFLKEGYMEKTGPKVSCLWEKKSSRELPESH